MASPRAKHNRSQGIYAMIEAEYYRLMLYPNALQLITTDSVFDYSKQFSSFKIRGRYPCLLPKVVRVRP